MFKEDADKQERKPREPLGSFSGIVFLDEEVRVKQEDVQGRGLREGRVVQEKDEEQKEGEEEQDGEKGGDGEQRALTTGCRSMQKKTINECSGMRRSC